MRKQWGICQELYRWCVATFGPTTTSCGDKKVRLSVPDALEELLASAGDICTTLDQNIDEEQEELGFFE